MRKKIYSAAVTPLNENGELDVVSMERMLNRNIKHGVDGFFFLGSMGEWNELTDSLKKDVVKNACEIIGPRAKTLVGIADTGLERVLENQRRYQKYDFDAYVLMLTSKVLNWIDPVEFILKVADCSDRDLYLYHIPAVTGVTLDLDQFRRVLSHPRVRGLKNSSGDMRFRKEIVMLKDEIEFEVFEGEEWTVDEALMVGCDGALVGMGSLASRPLRLIGDAISDGDFVRANSVQCDLIKIFHGIYGDPLSSIINGQKYALNKLGLLDCAKTLKQFCPLSDQRKNEIENCLEEFRDLLD